MMEYLKALNEEKGTTIILITHDMNVVRKYARRAIVLTDGHLVFSGTPQELFEGDQPVERWGLRRPVVSERQTDIWSSAARPRNCLKAISLWNAGACAVPSFPSWLPVWEFPLPPVKNSAR